MKSKPIPVMPGINRNTTFEEWKAYLLKEGWEIKETPRGYGYVGEFGRAHFTIDCPFCSSAITIYPWSFVGCGKICPECGAKMYSLNCFREIKK